MTIKKAKLYRTAVVASKLEGFGLIEGDVVSVSFVSRGAFGLNFKISSPYMQIEPAVVSEHDLKEFVL